MAVILNVEDDSPSRFLKSRILERAGFEVVEAVTAADAVRTAAKTRSGSCCSTCACPTATASGLRADQGHRVPRCRS